MNKLHNVLILAAFLLMPLSFATAQENEDGGNASTAASVFKVDEANNYTDNLALRDARKIGLGLGVGGSLGLYGFNIEVNFEDINGAIAGVGGGDGYSSFHVLWKHTFQGDTVAPYTTAGYSRWHNATGRGDFKNSGILERVLSDEEKATGRFATDFFSGSVGLQYTHLNGVFAGAALFAEVVLLGDLHNGTLVPTGTFGTTYYF